MAERSAPPIGIDLGTTNPCVGVWQNGGIHIIPYQQPNKKNPFVKRLLGKRFSSKNVQDEMKLFPFEVFPSPDDKPMIPVQCQVGVKQSSIIEISSMVLRDLRDNAQAFLGCRIENAVISVPACFNDSQRLATVQAANMAGLKVMRIINEPTAAAITYGLTNMNADGLGKKNILILDLGGGTLDVSILTMERGNYQVKATAGDDHLGGLDFDNQLIRHCINELGRRHNNHLNREDLGRLRIECERAKWDLSSQLETRIVVPGINFDHPITRAKFEELNKHLFERCIGLVDKCLERAKMYRSSIDDIVLIGGSTKIPKVREMVQEFFDGKELTVHINPDQAVGWGAAIQAAISSGMSNKLPNLMVRDITTHSLGIDIAEQIFMIPKNTAIPTTEEVILNADQIQLPLKVYEGEKTKIQDNNMLGELESMKDAISFTPCGILTVCFNVDENGIFTVSAENTTAGQTEVNMMEIIRDMVSTSSSGEEIVNMSLDLELLNLGEDKYKQEADQQGRNPQEALGEKFRGHQGNRVNFPERPTTQAGVVNLRMPEVNPALAIPCRRSLMIDFALSREGFLELNMTSFRRNHKTEMTWKKIVDALFLPKTCLPLGKRSQMTAAERKWGYENQKMIESKSIVKVEVDACKSV
ncbi:heat shock cognate protein 2 [Cinnamomum micranthum f. kanehirae]|uniref:Heat shock cognate protein 2 n=1 Tax=Cinnamomum micranthum f. kanehirae TaxID=337451 RepID=A0A3S3NSH0_9MAGN|nr:heat shock cognate protein 2 [Cinnamomum micranthum f. kanehirae]